ncbi:hypothetical protein LJ707_13290 [Mucilaginibacter sp. UR6-1]|uniref:hypothetical protein n=1 Tax=Mucilaginibacter sp. UR6-1 TaxID=1435643 RepID=UPI001E5070B7|nr:hypothetical protein [Mucilaginibacter sp. UR6-1]MCC8409906.1 hypothetical protein [Mucilaginibacter sp. UR6-1]
MSERKKQRRINKAIKLSSLSDSRIKIKNKTSKQDEIKTYKPRKEGRTYKAKSSKLGWVLKFNYKPASRRSFRRVKFKKASSTVNVSEPVTPKPKNEKRK